MATSEVEICNLALAKAGQGVIDSLDEPVRLARICKLVYAHERDDLLRSYRWRFAIRRVTGVPASATPPPFGYARSFPVPIDTLRVLSVNELDTEFDPNLDPRLWEFEGNAIMTNEPAPISIRTIARTTDPMKFDANFTTVLVLRVARALLPSLRESNPSLMRDFFQEIEFATQRARFLSAIEGRPLLRRVQRDSWAGGHW